MSGLHLVFVHEPTSLMAVYDGEGSATMGERRFVTALGSTVSLVAAVRDGRVGDYTLTTIEREWLRQRAQQMRRAVDSAINRRGL